MPAAQFGELHLGKLQEEPGFAPAWDIPKAERSRVLLVGHHQLHSTTTSSTSRPSPQRRPAAKPLSLVFRPSPNPSTELSRVGFPTPTHQPR